MKQAIGITMGIGLVPFWANLFLYTYEKEVMLSLVSFDEIKAKHFHLIKTFIDDL